MLAAKNLSDAAYDNFLDHTFLGDRQTTIREYLATTGSGIMEEEPPESLKTRYGGWYNNGRKLCLQNQFVEIGLMFLMVRPFLCLLSIWQMLTVMDRQIVELGLASFWWMPTIFNVRQNDREDLSVPVQKCVCNDYKYWSWFVLYHWVSSYVLPKWIWVMRLESSQLLSSLCSSVSNLNIF